MKSPAIEPGATITLEASREKLAADIAAVATEATELLKDVGSRNVRKAQEALVQARTAMRSGGSELADSAAGFVQAHPLKAVSGAAAAGLLLGLLLARR